MTTPMQQLPILFDFRNVIVGNGYFATVRMRGRALVEEEGDETWVTSVTPVGLAVPGAERAEALKAFRTSWDIVLVELAKQADTYADFKAACEDLFNSQSQPVEAEWSAAHAEVQRRNLRLDDLPSQQYDASSLVGEVHELKRDRADPADKPDDPKPSSPLSVQSFRSDLTLAGPTAAAA